MYFAIAGIVFFVSFAMMAPTGLWNNSVKLLAIVVGGVTAFGVSQPLTIWVDEMTDGSYTYLLDPVVLAGVFAITVGLVEVLAQMLSKTRVAFPDAVDRFGGAAVGLVTAYVVCGIVMAMLHTSPLSHDAFSGKFVLGDTAAEVQQRLPQESGLTRPDLVWLGLAESLLNSSRLGGSPDGGFLPFSAALYVHSYAEHRRAFEAIDDSIVRRS